MDIPFWQTKKLTEMTSDEWESLCDGCGKCCLVKLEDEQSGQVVFTNVHCKLLETSSCRCRDYANRQSLVEDCLKLNVSSLSQSSWLPSTCAYRLLNENKPLPDWHPLVSGSSESVHESGNSVRGRVLSEHYVHPQELEEHIIHWVN